MRLWIAAACAAATLYGQTGAQVRGRIATQGGPVRGEVIAVANEGAVRISRAATDEQGRFTIETGAGQVLLVAKADGYVSQEQVVQVRPGTANANVPFLLWPAASVAGRVTDENGAGVAGARVWLDYAGEARRWRLAEEAGGEAADAFGYFRLPAVAQGRPFVLHAECEGWLMSSSGTLVVHAPETTGVLLVLSRHGAQVRGRVTDGAGNPVAGAEVRLRSVPAQGEFTAEQRASAAYARSTNRKATSAGDGSYAFAGVPAGQVVVTAEARGRRAGAEAAVSTGRDIEIVLELR